MLSRRFLLFFQAEDGIRDIGVTGVQTCALPIWVLLCTEGTYPFVGGGVSTWCDIICRELGDIDFSLYAITGLPETAYRYEPPSNVSQVVHVPLWGMTEPAEHLHQGHSYSSLRFRRRHTTPAVIEDGFIPLLKGLLAQISAPEPDPEEGGRVVHGMWRYFRLRDWQRTWRSEAAWRTFVAEALRTYEERPDAYLEDEVPSIDDLTTAMQWMYSYLMPLYAPVPEVDIVHSTIAGFAALPAIVAKYERGTSMLLTEHGVYIRERYISISQSDFTPFAKRFLLALASVVAKLAYHHAARVCPVADFNRRWEVPYGCSPDKIETVHNGVDPEVFQPRPKPQSTAGSPTVVAAARIFPLKDIKNMIRSAAVARESVPDVRYLLYGSLDADVPYVERCRRLIAELELEET